MTLTDETSRTMTELTELYNALSTKASGCAYAKVMKLNVGGRIFMTSPDTLRSESGLFRHQLSERFNWVPEDDGSYFLDADPELFEHLLNFMRRPSVFPLFYSKTAGFDYNLYNRLEGEAEYFQIDALRNWISAKNYHRTVVEKTSRPVTRNIQQIDSDSLFANQSEERHVVPRTKKVYLCPRLIPVHKGHPEMCGAACRQAQEGCAVQYEDETSLDVISIEREVVFDEGVCRASVVEFIDD